MQNVILKKCSACQGLVFTGWTHCASCGNDITKDGQLSPAFFYPGLKTHWGKTRWKELRNEGKRFSVMEKVPVLQGVKETVDKVFYEGEIASPMEGRDDEIRELSVDITDKTVTQRGEKRVLLKDIRLTIKDGEMVLILGGSGAGKTTFMNAVMGNERANARVTYGGMDLYEDYDRLKHYIGFVPQSDPLRMDDTVYMTLQNAAELKLPGQLVKDPVQLDKRIRDTLETVGLSAESGNTVRKLSGGQRKRLSIASEYITDPHLFFLDEPDSGLDGGQARILMDNLRTIADAGKIVMLISHSPDRAAPLFDKVIVLAKDKNSGTGGLSFFGTVKDALAFYNTSSLEAIVSVLDA